MEYKCLIIILGLLPFSPIVPINASFRSSFKKKLNYNKKETNYYFFRLLLRLLCPDRALLLVDPRDLPYRELLSSSSSLSVSSSFSTGTIGGFSIPYRSTWLV